MYKGDRNNIQDCIEFVKKHIIKITTQDDELIFFGQKYDADCRVTVGKGNDDDHFNLCFTSSKLLERLKLTDIYHIDCTYKIVKYFFPVLVFGITDIDRKFQPIAFMITSHETHIDFS